MKKSNVDFFITGLSLIIILITCGIIVIFPNESKIIIDKVFDFCTIKLGFIYIWVFLLSFIICLWLVFGKYKNVKLGDVEPEYSKLSWCSMMFAAGMASGLIYWGSIEWVYYYTSPAFDIEPFSWLAAEYASTYPLFHWGILPYCIYFLPAIALAMVYRDNKSKSFSFSEACRPILGNLVDGALGKVINILFIIGLLGGIATSLGFGTPLVASCVSFLFNISLSKGLTLIILACVIVLFSTSAYLGMKKGIKVLSDVNVVFMLIIVLFIFIVGPTGFMIKIGTTSIGIMVSEFVRMSTWMDPVLNNGFVESWTIFYWAWWMAYSLFMGLFVAKISRGKKIKEVIVHGVIFGFAGIFVVFNVFGNYGLNLQLTGKLDIVSLLSKIDTTSVIVKIFSTLPFGEFIVGCIGIISVLFLATTFDSASYVLSMVSSKNLDKTEEPKRFFRVFWALIIALIPIAMLIIDAQLQALQTLSIALALPVTIVYVLIVSSLIKVLRKIE